MLATILGAWIFTSLIYQGQSMPLPNPNLKIRYEFLADGKNILHYRREGEEGFCERQAIYEHNGRLLIQQVNWVNPNNAMWCSQDTDMQLGSQTWTPAWVEGDKMYLKLKLSDEDLIYVWDRIPAEE